jgi:DNA-binding NarL/FixJ family response regulator
MAGAHVVLVDSRTEGALGLCAALRRSGGATVIFVAAPDEGGWPQMALAAGARGLLGKSTRPTQLLQALRVVQAGGVWAPRRVMAECIEKLTRTSASDRAAEPSVARQLSLREREVFRHAATGLGNKEIAERLDINKATVEAHLTQIFQKLGVSGRAQLAAVYHGLTALLEPPRGRRPPPPADVRGRTTEGLASASTLAISPIDQCASAHRSS